MKFKLTEEQKKYFLEIGYSEEDFQQLAMAMCKKYTTYELEDKKGNKPTKISKEEAIQILGEETYLSGIARSAFHWSSVRDNAEGNLSVRFDSSKLIK